MGEYYLELIQYFSLNTILRTILIQLNISIEIMALCAFVSNLILFKFNPFVAIFSLFSIIVDKSSNTGH